VNGLGQDEIHEDRERNPCTCPEPSIHAFPFSLL
jgi:hypothetical protein